MLFRLVVLLAIAGALVIFTWSNLQPIALTFLGIQTPAFPLALWVLLAIAAGILTTLTIGVLFSLSSYATMREARAQFRQAAQRSGFGEFRREGFQPKSPFSAGSRQASTRSTVSGAAQSAAKADDSAWRDWEGYEQPGDRKQTPKSPTTNEEDDWNLDSSGDWEDESPNPVDRHRADQTNSKRDAQPQPKSSSRSESTYSYGSKDPGTTGVGKQEKVVDAEYRVIIPPYTPSVYTPPPPPPPSKPTPEEENADDWFEDDR